LKLYRIYRRQELNLSLEEAWSFFSSPKNLIKITPPYMGFEIKFKLNDDKIFPGMIIEYIVKPLFNIPLKWVTEITHMEEMKYFIDEQRFGPYKMWHHVHRFKVENGKLIMEDIVDYILPFGIFGSIAHCIFVKNRIEEIFDYRSKILKEIFG
jgi:ligand-binding SRPBCC domain-containing protein